MSRFGIRQRLLLLALLPAALVGTILYLYFLNYELRELSSGLDDHGRTIAGQLAPASEYAVVTGNRHLLEQLVRGVIDDHSVSGVAVLDTQGHVLINHNGLRAGVTLRPNQSPALCGEEEDERVYCAPIRRTLLPVSDFEDVVDKQLSERLGTAVVRLSSAPMHERRRALVFETIAITLGVLVVVGWVAVLTGRRIALPLESLSRAVAEVTAGDLSVRTPVDGSGELRRLQVGLNQMIDALRASRDDLERRVDDATARLRRTLAELESVNLDLDEQRQRAQDASSAKSQFLAVMSHEIRTPLSGILGMLTLLQGTRLDPVQSDYLHNLDLAARALRTLIDDILDFSRIEAGKLQLGVDPFDPRVVTEDVATLLAPSAHAKGLELVCHIAPGFPGTVHGDAARLRQVLINLVGNAIKFTERGRVVIRASAIDPGIYKRARFEVEDTGVGIPPEQQARIFESFTQVDLSTNRRYGGSGLGTAIARELVTLMGGTIGVRSTPGAGSTFWFEIPWRCEPNPADLRFAGVRAWLVEENRESAEAFTELGRALGLTIEQATASDCDARLAAEMKRRDRVALLFLAEDSARSERDELARGVRGLLGAHAPALVHVCYFTGSTTAGLYDVTLTKPVTRRNLEEQIGRVLDREQGHDAELPPQSARTAERLEVLLAEDDAINAKVIHSFLTQAGHQVTLAGNGELALAALRSGDFDVVLMDLRMPVMDGLEATRRWREEEHGVHVPIIALTANATLEDRAECFAAGMDAFLPKPVTPSQLQAALERLVANRSEQRESA